MASLVRMNPAAASPAAAPSVAVVPTPRADGRPATGMAPGWPRVAATEIPGTSVRLIPSRSAAGDSLGLRGSCARATSVHSPSFSLTAPETAGSTLRTVTRPLTAHARVCLPSAPTTKIAPAASRVAVGVRTRMLALDLPISPRRYPHFRSISLCCPPGSCFTTCIFDRGPRLTKEPSRS